MVLPVLGIRVLRTLFLRTGSSLLHFPCVPLSFFCYFFFMWVPATGNSGVVLPVLGIRVLRTLFFSDRVLPPAFSLRPTFVFLLLFLYMGPSDGKLGCGAPGFRYSGPADFIFLDRVLPPAFSLRPTFVFLHMDLHLIFYDLLVVCLDKKKPNFFLVRLKYVLFRLCLLMLLALLCRKGKILLPSVQRRNLYPFLLGRFACWKGHCNYRLRE